MEGGDGHTHDFGGEPHCLSVSPTTRRVGSLLHQQREIENSGKADTQTHTEFIPTFISMQAFGKDHL